MENTKFSGWPQTFEVIFIVNFPFVEHTEDKKVCLSPVRHKVSNNNSDKVIKCKQVNNNGKEHLALDI